MSEQKKRKYTTWRRFRAGRKVRRILFGIRPLLRDLSPNGWQELHCTYHWASIIGFYTGKGRVTYQEVYRIAEELAPRLKPYPVDNFYKWRDLPYRRAFSLAIRAFESKMSLEERMSRQKHFCDTLNQGRRRSLARRAFAQNLCPVCLDPLPCSYHGIGRVVRDGYGFIEVDAAPDYEYDPIHVEETDDPASPEEEAECREAVRSCESGGVSLAGDGEEPDRPV